MLPVALLTSANVDKTGFDPEIFVVDGKDKLIPAFTFLESSQKDPRTYWDGFQAEFTVKPQRCHGWLMDEVSVGLNRVRTLARNKFRDAKLTLQSVFPTDELFLKTFEPAYVELGCNPSLNAHNTNPFFVENPYQLPVRMAGGHIHYSYNYGLKPEHISDIVRLLDIHLAIPTVGMFSEIDNLDRRKYYGRAGEYRDHPEESRFEYRTLSNAWLGSPIIANLVSDLGRLAVGNYAARVDPKDFGSSWEEIRDIIDETNVPKAREFFHRNRDYYKSLLQVTYNMDESISDLDQLVMGGVESLIPKYRDIDHNWGLNAGATYHSKPRNNAIGTWLEFYFANHNRKTF